MTDVPRRALEPATCLVVDDEVQLRQTLVRLLEKDGFVCHQAGTGLEALDVLAVHPVSLILSDLRMPGMDGVQLLKAVRQRYPDIAMVMISAVDDVDTAVTCLADGAMDYLPKPFHVREVRQRLRQALEKRALLMEAREYKQTLERRVAEQSRRLEALFFTSMQSLADALEAKDRYTHGHAGRVSYYASLIAGEMALPGSDTAQVALGGHVHDIGKIGVRGSVLNKPGRLTSGEYEHLMTHPMVGWKILAPLLNDMPKALNIVRWHHERIDGRGIPDGLVGEYIPLEARIASVADAFDAMTSRRPYRPGLWLTLDAAVMELRANRGTQFDESVTDAFVAVLERGGVDWAKMIRTMEGDLGDGWPHTQPGSS